MPQRKERPGWQGGFEDLPAPLSPARFHRSLTESPCPTLSSHYFRLHAYHGILGGTRHLHRHSRGSPSTSSCCHEAGDGREWQLRWGEGRKGGSPIHDRAERIAQLSAKVRLKSLEEEELESWVVLDDYLRHREDRPLPPLPPPPPPPCPSPITATSVCAPCSMVLSYNTTATVTTTAPGRCDRCGRKGNRMRVIAP